MHEIETPEEVHERETPEEVHEIDNPRRCDSHPNREHNVLGVSSLKSRHHRNNQM